MGTHGTMDTRTTDTEETAEIPTGPSWVVLFAIDADLVVGGLDERTKDFGVGFGLRSGLGDARHGDDDAGKQPSRRMISRESVGVGVGVVCICL